MTCPFKMANCKNHDPWTEEYGDTFEGHCVHAVWYFCTDPIEPENFEAEKN